MMCVSLLVGLRLIDDVSSNFHCFVTHSQHIRGLSQRKCRGTTNGQTNLIIPPTVQKGLFFSTSVCSCSKNVLATSNSDRTIPLIQKLQLQLQLQLQQEEEAVQVEEPAINHHNAIMSALRRRVNRSKDELRDGDASTTSRSSTNSTLLRNRLYDRQSKKDKLKRLHLIGQHYKIDQNNRALLPGVPKYDEDLGRDAHDFFNLICLVSVKGIRYIGYCIERWV